MFPSLLWPTSWPSLRNRSRISHLLGSLCTTCFHFLLEFFLFLLLLDFWSGALFFLWLLDFWSGALFFLLLLDFWSSVGILVSVLEWDWFGHSSFLGFLDFWSVLSFLAFWANRELISGQLHKVSLSRLSSLENPLGSCSSWSRDLSYFD